MSVAIERRAVRARRKARLRIPAMPGWSRTLVVMTLLNLSVQPWRAEWMPIPKRAEQVGTIVAVALAFVLAYLGNRRLAWPRVPAYALGIVLAAAAAVPWMSGTGSAGSIARAGRVVAVVLTMWLLAPRALADDLEFVRVHTYTYSLLVVSIVLGSIFATHLAYEPTLGRLRGVIPAATAPRVGEMCAVALGLCLLGIVFRLVRARWGLLLAFFAATGLGMSQTRTAIMALGAGLIVAMLSLIRGSARARRAGVIAIVAGGLAALLAAGALQTWFARNQDAEKLRGLSGRRAVWERVLDEPRGGQELWFGTGLADKRFDGHPIDSGWVTAYYEQGLVGAGITGAAVLVLLWSAVRLRPSPARAGALFLVVFAGVSATTETGISEASPYFIHLLVAGVSIAGARATQRRRTCAS